MTKRTAWRDGAAGLVLAAALGWAGAAAAAPSLGEPSLSPDGAEVAFVSGGDIWSAPAQGGVARLLVTDQATESRPLFSPDGTKLAFVSTRSGAANIYVLTLASGEITRLTWSDAGEQLDGWSRDGRWLYFASGANDVGRQADIFRVSAQGGTPLEVSRDRYLNEFQSAPSPDGKSVALMVKGISNGQWWRNGHAHIDETELWLKPLAAGEAPRQVAGPGAKHAYPMWSPDGATLYYMSDESGAENLWSRPAAGGPARQLTRFTDGRVLWPTIGYDGRAIVFERGFGVWRLDLMSGEAKPLAVTLRGAAAGAGERHLNETSFRRAALSPDGKKMAVIAHGEVFAAPAKEGGPAQRLTRTAAAESDITWAPDSRRLFYVGEREGPKGLATQLLFYDFGTAKEQALTKGDGRDEAPAVSPKGERIAYVRDTRELRLATLDAKGAVTADRVLYTGALEDDPATPAWSPDGRWLAFVVTDRRSFRNLHVIDTQAAGAEARPITFLANGATGSRIAWSPDGTFIVFDTAQRSEDVRMVRVDLLPHVPKYREDAFQDLFKPAESPDKPSTRTPAPSAPTRSAPKPKDAPAEAKTDAPARGDAQDKADDEDSKGKKPPVKPVRIVFEGLRDRATILPLGVSAEQPVISPDGKTLVFTAHQGERENLYSYSLDELSLEPPSPVQLTSTERPKGDYAFTPDSKTLFYRDGPKLFSTPVESPKPKPLAVSAEMDVDFASEKAVVFEEAWDVLNRRFYDSTFGGRDWAALRARFQPQVDGARTPDELRRIINLMIGELNASHSGINAARDPATAATQAHVAELGLHFERTPYEAGRGLVVREVVKLGPAAIEGTVKPGETLLAVDGEAVGPHTSLNRLLLGKVGRRTVLRVADTAGRARDVVVSPVNAATEAGLMYRQWVDERRAYVDRISGGKLGYVHIADMGDESLQQLYIDLDAQNQSKQGVVIDIRNNNGGYINGYALDVFTRRNYLTLTTRGMFPVPSRQALGQRSLGLPTVLVINESSLSDAEDFTEGYRSLGLGKVVGSPTAGWIIYTSGQPLIDGSTVRVPGTRVEDGRGQNMEGHPRPVDVPVLRPLGETEAGRDAQLEAAVKVLTGG